MPRGPKGEKRPVIGNAVHVVRMPRVVIFIVTCSC